MTSTGSMLDRVHELGLCEAVFEVCLDPIIVIDDRGLVLGANAALERTFGYSSGELVGRNVSMLMPSPVREEHDGYIRAYLETGRGSIIGQGREVEGQHRNGSIFPLWLAVVETQVAGVRYFVGTVHDLSRQKAREEALEHTILDMDVTQREYEAQAGRMAEMAEELSLDKDRLARQEAQLRRNEEELTRYIQDLEMTRGQFETQASEMAYLAEDLAMEKDRVEESKRIIEHQATHDVLTDLGNRMLLVQSLPRMLARADDERAGVGFIYIDLDNFKPVNDRLGHDAGDRLLCDVADGLRATIGPEDLAIRQGGDEFAVLAWLPSGQGEAELRALAERIRLALTIPVRGDGFEIQTGASIGIALYPRDGATMDEILKAADDAMYRAKKLGKGRVC